jgi:hypothetical protein
MVPSAAVPGARVTSASLYRRLLGPDFDRLPPALRRFHDASGGASAAGVVCVRRGGPPVARAVARILRLPPEGDRVDVRLRVTAENDGRECWERMFAAHRLRTTQWLERGRLVERVGAAAFTFDVAADERGMRFRSVGFRWLGVPVPPRLAIGIDADVRGFDEHWNVKVIVRAARAGVISSYEGRITPTSR